MKRLISLLAVLSIAACTTDELNAFGNAAKPIADVAVGAASAYLGLPPGSAAVINAAKDSLWGASVQKWGKQPAAQGAIAPPIGAAIQNALPAVMSDTQQALLLQKAAQQLETTASGLPGGGK